MKLLILFLFLLLLIPCYCFCAENTIYIDLENISSSKTVFWVVGGLIVILSPFVINRLMDKKQKKNKTKSGK